MRENRDGSQLINNNLGSVGMEISPSTATCNENVKRAFLFGLSFCAAQRKAILSHVRSLSGEARGTSVLFANAHVVVEAHNSVLLKSAISKASVIIPDGMPITWVLKGKGYKLAERYSGPDFMQDILEMDPGAAHFFLGSTPMTLQGVLRRFKGTPAGFYSPPFVYGEFSEQEKCRQLEMIEHAKPDFIWVGLGAPKQEYYVTEMSARYGRGVWLAVGAAFDFYGGPKPRAPEWLQQAGLEWAFRLAVEPRRLGPRYLRTNPVFMTLALRELLQRSDNRSHGDATDGGPPDGS
jgi:N-acetylglucosaminyldiphosphoundecaprenol N-acetyl-beta-D-mannosaminyltransferase